MAQNPAAFVEPGGQKLFDLLMKELGKPMDIGAISPKVAGVSPLIQEAQKRAASEAGLGSLEFDPTTGAITGVGPGTGVASYERFLDKAEAAAGPDAYKQYMSPYQTEVLDATQTLLNEQRAAGRPQLAAQAIEAGAFGGGREGVQRAEYERGRDISDAGIMANLRTQGLQQAQKLAQQDLRNQIGLAQTGQGLSSNVISSLGNIGTGAMTYDQSLLEAERQRALLGQEYPTSRIATATNIFGSLASNVPGAPPAPIMSSPGIAGLQGAAGTFNLLGGAPGQGINSMAQFFR